MIICLLNLYNDDNSCISIGTNEVNLLSVIREDSLKSIGNDLTTLTPSSKSCKLSFDGTLSW